MNGPGFTWRFLLLGWGKEIGGVWEISVSNGTEWDPGEPGSGGEMAAQVEEGLFPLGGGGAERGAGCRTRAV